MSPPQANLPEPTRRTAWQRVIYNVDRLGPGDLADLRRLRPDDLGHPAFWRLAADVLEPAGLLPGGGPARDRAEARWAASLSAVARLYKLHRAKRSLGEALGAAGYAELRFVRLLRAQGPALWEAVRTASQYLASKAEAADLVDFIELVESDGHAAWGEHVRRRLARAYYRRIEA